MSADYIDVSKEIEIEGIPVKVSAVFWPDEDQVTNAVASVAEKNPDNDDGGFWTIEADGDTMLVGKGELLPPHLLQKHDAKIQRVAEEAAKATHV